MSKHGMSILAALALIVPAAVGSPWASPDAGAARDLMAVTVSSDAQGNPVVTISGDGALRYETLELDSPRRLVLDLPGTNSRVMTRQVPVGVGGVERVRVGQYRVEPEPVSRVVFDLQARESRRGERGRVNVVWTPRGGHFTSTDIQSVAFIDDPGIQPGRSPKTVVDTVTITGTGRWNGRRGYTFEAVATDRGEPGGRGGSRETPDPPGPVPNDWLICPCGAVFLKVCVVTRALISGSTADGSFMWLKPTAARRTISGVAGSPAIWPNASATAASTGSTWRRTGTSATAACRFSG